MNSIRRVQKVWGSTPTVEGAGVRLRRAFGYHQVPELNPFLLLDDFHSDDERDYIAGFPWHPHRGIETITYVLHGKVEHRDSIGNGGVIESNDVQWMTAGSGIIHQEMPKGPGLIWGLQLWANLPASQKMIEPRYRDVKGSMIPVVTPAKGVRVKIICGEIDGAKGPVQDIVAHPQYMDISIDPGAVFSRQVEDSHRAFAYVLEGSGRFDDMNDNIVGTESVVLFGEGNGVEIEAGDEGIRFLLISGKPLQEPVAWYGPVVMNTQEELRIAFEEYENGTFIKHEKTAVTKDRSLS